MLRIELPPKRYTGSQDLVCFMTAYHVNYKVRKFSFPFFHKEPNPQTLLKKYHISTLATDGFVITPEFIEKYNFFYDPVWQKATMSFIDRKDTDKEDQKRHFDKVRTVYHMYYSAERFLSNDLTKLSRIFEMEPFQVEMNTRVFQVKSLAYDYGGVVFVEFELSDVNTGLPLDANSIIGIRNHLNLHTANRISYFEDKEYQKEHRKICDIIFDNVTGFIAEYTKRKEVVETYLFLHNYLVFSEKNINVTEYATGVSGAIHPNDEIRNLSTSKDIEYYSLNNLGVIIPSSPQQLKDGILFDYLMLESFKMLIFLKQIISYNYSKKLSELRKMDKHINYLLHFPANIVITAQVIENIKAMTVYRQWESALSFKEKCLQTEQDEKKANNGIVLNVLLYILAYIGGIGSVDTICTNFELPFILLFCVLSILFICSGVYWIYHEKKRD